jgi:hypothetical protein
MKDHAITIAIFAAVIWSCAPDRKTRPSESPKAETLGANDESEQTTSVSRTTTQPTGRAVDLYAIRANAANGFVPPEIDKLPCPFFRQGAAFKIPAIQGGPPIALPGPLQNHYAGVWNGSDQYRFKVSAYNRIYRDPGIPDWLLTTPTSRAIEYVSKLFDVTVLRPTQANCTISAKALN